MTQKDKESISKRINDLRSRINQANYEYHTLDNPTISDAKYDEMINELIKLEDENPEFFDPASPTQKVGGNILESFTKVRHDVPMMSLSNVYNINELELFVSRITKVNQVYNYVCEQKIDGLAVSLKYENGQFVQASTRGNGVVGEDITQNVKTIKSLPLILSEPLTIEVRGEIYMSHDSFIKANQQRTLEGMPLFANPRNAAAGTMRQLDSKVVAKRGLSLFVYTLVDATKYVKTQSDVLSFLKQLRLPVNQYYKMANSFDELVSNIEYFDQLRKTLSYETDGVVIKVNQLTDYDLIGYTAKSPKWATAYKFQPEQEETKLLDIIYQVGRTGVITPVAILDKVLISGSYVQRATLHNEDYIKEKDIRVNDYVFVHKAGEIIPEVIKVNMDKRSNQEPFKMITNCPVCNYPIQRKQGEADYYCTNPECPGKNVYGLIHFASRVAMDIDTLGEKVIETFHDLGYLTTIADIYNLKNYKDELITLDGFGEKKIQNILNAIEKSKMQSFDRLLFGLGIKFVGIKVAKTLVSNFDNIDKLIDASYDELIDIFDIGEAIAKSVKDYFNNPKNLELIDELKKQGLNFEYKNSNFSRGIFDNKTFVVTGKLNKYSRDEIQSLIESLGGKATSSVSNKTDYLIAGEDSGSKLTKALELNVKILNEEEFEDLINHE